MYRLLMVDDEELIVNSMCSSIEENFEVELYRAFSAFEALELLRKMRFDLVITDISMPVMSGIDLLKRIKQTWPECHVILLTAYKDFDYAYQSMKYNKVDYVLKIEKYPVIHQLIKNALERLDQDKEREQLFIRMGEHFEQIKPRLREDLMMQVLKYGAVLPEMEKLKNIGFNLDGQQRVMLIAGMLDADHYAYTMEYVNDISVPLTEKLRRYGLRFQQSVLDHYLVWMVQCEEQDKAELQEQASRIRDCFENFPEVLQQRTGMNIMLVTSEFFVEWHDLSALFNRMTLRLEQSMGAHGMISLPVDVPNLPREKAVGLTVADMDSLWELLRVAQPERFIAYLAEKLQFLACSSDMTTLLPSAEVSVVSLLYLNGRKLFGISTPLDTDEHRVLSCLHHPSGQQWLQEVLNLFHRLMARRSENHQSSATWLLQHIDQYIAEHYQEDIHLTSIAEEFHYSPSYLSRTYKEISGESLTIAISNYRLKRAKQLLENSALPTHEIAQSCGFYSIKYFMQVFKAKWGCTPMQYRKNSGT